MTDYNIECVCCTSGNTQKNHLEDFRLNKDRKSIVCDMNKVNAILYSRITQAIIEKFNKTKQ